MTNTQKSKKSKKSKKSFFIIPSYLAWLSDNVEKKWLDYPEKSNKPDIFKIIYGLLFALIVSLFIGSWISLIPLIILTLIEDFFTYDLTVYILATMPLCIVSFFIYYLYRDYKDYKKYVHQRTNSKISEKELASRRTASEARRKSLEKKKYNKSKGSGSAITWPISNKTKVTSNHIIIVLLIIIIFGGGYFLSQDRQSNTEIRYIPKIINQYVPSFNFPPFTGGSSGTKYKAPGDNMIENGLKLLSPKTNKSKPILTKVCVKKTAGGQVSKTVALSAMCPFGYKEIGK